MSQLDKKFFQTTSTPQKTEEQPSVFQKEPTIKPETPESTNQYSSEARQEQITMQSTMIREWANQQGFEEGKDYKIIENIRDIVGQDGEVEPHETKAFYMAIHEKHYKKFRDYFLSEYKEKVDKKDPNNDTKLIYSWGGRFAVGWSGVLCDTAPSPDIEKLTASTNHAEFKNFFHDKTGFEFPSAETLNPLLQEMSEKGLSSYEEVLKKLNELKDTDSLPEDAYGGVLDEVQRAVDILKKAKNGTVVQELPEIISGEMPPSMRFYADLTYNNQDIGNFDRAIEITNIEIPDEARLDKIFDKYNFDTLQMQSIMRDFSDYIINKRELENT